MEQIKEQIVRETNRKIYQVLTEDTILRQDETLREMALYSLGMAMDGSLLSGGKRLRPLFCCLSCGILSGSHSNALGYGVGLEILHNFTLVHDDIEDNGDVRHNRPAVWKKYGLASALNAGDLLYQIALRTIADADMGIGKVRGLSRMMKMSADLFLGQHRDISFEKVSDISEDDYFCMVSGKTSALLGLSFAFGAYAAGADDSVINDFEKAGQQFGLAFQIRDDYLGTWGDSKLLGKSVSGDITEKKKTLAVVYTAAKDALFREKWAAYDGNHADAHWFANRMAECGAPEYLYQRCAEFAQKSIDILEQYRVENVYQIALDTIFSNTESRVI